MSKLFLQCCCQYFNDNEEEKVQKAVKIESFQVKTQNDSANIIQGLSINEDNSLLAAPFPHSDGGTGDPKLRIQIIESTGVSVGTVLNIGPTGLENSKRNKSDYKTFIGAVLSENDEILNDFVIEESSKGMGKRHLVIKYNPTRQKYLITDLGDGSGTFVRIDSALVLKDGYIISFGNSHMTIHYNSTSK